MKLSDLQKKVKSVEVDYQDETLHVDYLVNAVTPGFLNDKPDLYEQIRRVVVAWDVLDENGNPLPPADIIQQMPVTLLDLILQAIVQDMRIGSAQKKA
jgi:hypothetical protein